MLQRSDSKWFILGLGAVALAVLFLAMGFVTTGDAQTAPGLGAASTYAVLGGQTVTNTGPTTIGGDVGVSPGTAVTGFPPGMVTGGTIHSADAHASQAQDAVTTAYNALAAQPCTEDLTGQDLGGMTLTEGVYCFSSSAQLTGILTLDAQGSAGAVFIFKIGSTLTTASNASVLVTNGGTECNVFWQVGSSATIGTGTEFVGNILALTSITLNTGASVSGRALARNGSVTLDSNDVDISACSASTATASPTDSASPTGSPSPTGSASPTVSAPPTGTGTATATATRTATATPVGQTPTPGSQTATPTPAGPTATPTVAPTPSSAPTNTPSPAAPAAPGFPSTGGPPAQEASPWVLLLVVGLALSSLGATSLVLTRRD